MGTNPVTPTCKLTKVSNRVFKSTPGLVTLSLVSKTGNVAFDSVTDVVDSSNKSVGPTKTANTLSFTVVAGQTYFVETLYVFLPPNSTGVLQEGCPGGIILSDVDPLTNPQKFEVRG